MDTEERQPPRRDRERSHDDSRGRRRDQPQRGRDGGRDGGPPQVGAEKLSISSGHVLIIDQFMLGNAQYLRAVEDSVEGGMEFVQAATEHSKRYGGAVLPLAKGEYQVLRDPLESIMVIVPQESSAAKNLDVSEVVSQRDALAPESFVFVDTRCVVFIDVEILERSQVVEEYKVLRRNGDEKRARDMLREHGAAVRYGFKRQGDELGVTILKESGYIVLAPDVAA